MHGGLFNKVKLKLVEVGKALHVLYSGNLILDDKTKFPIQKKQNKNAFSGPSEINMLFSPFVFFFLY